MEDKNMANKPKDSLFRRLFGFGRTEEVDIFVEEQTQSPFRTIAKNFISSKTALLGLVAFVVVAIICFGYTAFFPVDVNYKDMTQIDLPPGFKMMAVPKELENNVKEIDAGAGYGIGIDQGGKYYQWGILTRRMERIPSFMGPLEKVSAGYDHILALDMMGNVYSWGSEQFGLGMVPLELSSENIRQLEAGHQFSVALTEEGQIYFWGNDNIVNVNTEKEEGNIAEVAINTSTIIARTKDGRVTTLSTIESPFTRIPESIQEHTVSIASTDAVAAALLDDGTVVTWGKMGDAAVDVPEEIQGNVKQISSGRNHFSVTLKDGSVASWGDNSVKQTNAPNLSNIDRVSAGYHQNYAVDKSGKVHTWGLKGYIMGTDQYGRDMFQRLAEGGKMTMTVGAIAVIISAVIGIIIGGIAGYYGGRIDNILMRIAEIVNAIPFLPLAMILSAIITRHVSETGRIAMIMVILGILSWPSLARLVRAEILAEREKEYIMAAKATGVKELAIVFRHILPNIITTILVNLTLSFASSMLTEATLSFIGFGVVEPRPTWGNMLTSAQSSIVIGQYWWRWVFPGAALSICSISINMIGDGLREAIDPKSQEQ